MSFDFSIYDYEDNTPAAKKRAEEPKKKNEAFDFDLYESEYTPKGEKSAKADKIYQQYAPRELTPKDLSKMSSEEKQEYAQELVKGREYLQSAGFTKGALSGATLGGTESIEALRPQEHELNANLGRLLGASTPITAFSKLASIPMAYSGLTGIAKTAAHGALTGAGYGGATQATKAATGQEVDLKEIPKTAAEFALFPVIIGHGGSALWNKFKGLSSSAQTSLLEKKIIPEGLPKSQYETAEEILNALQSGKAQPQKTIVPIPQTKVKGEPSSLTGRASKEAPEKLGMRPVPITQGEVGINEVGNQIYPYRFYNSTKGGESLRSNIIAQDEAAYENVNQLYEKSRELNRRVNEIHPELVEDLSKKLEDLKAIPEPSDVQKRVIRTAQNNLKRLVAFDEQGNITGYRTMNNQTLIDQIQALRQIIDYDFAHGNTKNIFKPLINDLQNAAYDAAQNSGAEDAAIALTQARKGYREWAELYDSHYVRPFRDRSNQDFSKLFKGAQDLDEFNQLNRILSQTEEGEQLASGLRREIVEKRLSPFFENAQKANQRDFDTAVRELEAVISPEQSSQIRLDFQKAKAKSPTIRAKKMEKAELTPSEKIAAKYLEKSPEDVQKMLDSRTGIRHLRKDVTDKKIKPDLFEKLTKQKMRSILREGNIEADFTGEQLYNVLNKEKNFELFSEIIGEEETEALRLTAKEVGKDQAKNASRKEAIRGAAKKVLGYKALKTILDLF